MNDIKQNIETGFSNIGELRYNKMSVYHSEVLKQGKVGLFNKGMLKKIVASIEEGNASYIKINIGESFHTSMLSSNDGYDTYVYYRMKTEDDNFINKGVQVIDKFNPEDGSYAYLLQFKIKKTVYYIIVESVNQEYLLDNAKRLMSIDTNSTNTCVIPELREKSLIDKGIDALVNKFFKNKD